MIYGYEINNKKKTFMPLPLHPHGKELLLAVRYKAEWAPKSLWGREKSLGPVRI
jgi:hypothetical protein